MLKQLFTPQSLALISLVAISTTAIPANAETGVFTSAIAQDKLIVKEEKVTEVNADRQADLTAIHQTLTQFYRGLNEYSVDRLVVVSVAASADEREYARQMFSQLKSAGIDISIEIKRIELVSLSDRQATLNIDQLLTIRKSHKSANSRQFASVELIKQRGRWRVSRNNTIAASFDRH